MGPARFEPARQQARDGYARAPTLVSPHIAFLPAIALRYLPMGDRFPAAFANRHTVARHLMAVDRPVDRAAGTLRRPPHQSQIAALERPSVATMACKLSRQAFVSAVILGNHHQAGGVLVEPVHDAWPPFAANAGQARAAVRD